MAERTRSSHAWSRLVLSAVLALANGKPWKVHMPSSARAAGTKEHHQGGDGRADESRHGEYSVVDGRIITTIRRRAHARNAASRIRFGANCSVDGADKEQRRAFGRTQQRSMARIETARQVVRHRDIERPQAIDALAHVRRGEHQHRLIERARRGARPGRRDRWSSTCARRAHRFRSSATKPSGSQNSRIGSKSAAGTLNSAKSPHSELSPRSRSLEKCVGASCTRTAWPDGSRNPNSLNASSPTRFQAISTPSFSMTCDVLRDVRLHVGDGGRRKLELVQADIEAAVGHHAVGMLPGVGGAALTEAESFVESDRRGDVRRLEADFVELA